MQHARAAGSGAPRFAVALLLACLAISGCGGSDDGEARRRSASSSSTSPAASSRPSPRSAPRRPTARTRSSSSTCPSDADGQREQLVRRLGAEDSSIDLIGMDVIWTGEFANAGWLGALPRRRREGRHRGGLPQRPRHGGVRGPALRRPRSGPTPSCCWYRSDLVDKPPKTWDEMIDEAEKIGPEEGLIQVQANRYEGLTVWANQMIASAGGEIISGQDELVARAGADRARAGGHGPRSRRPRRPTRASPRRTRTRRGSRSSPAARPS